MQYGLVSAMIGLTHAQTYIRIVSCKADFTWKLSNFQRIISPYVILLFDLVYKLPFVCAWSKADYITQKWNGIIFKKQDQRNL